MRRSSWLLGMAALALLVAPIPHPPATASCSGPYLKDVALQLIQDDRTWDLAAADAGSADDSRLGWVTWTFDVPRGVKPGRAKLVADYHVSVKIRVR